MRFCTECGTTLPGADAVNAPAAPAPQPASPAPAGAEAGLFAMAAPAPPTSPPPMATPPPPAAAPPAPVATGHPTAPGSPGAPDPMLQPSGPVCWRCRGAGDMGADFCKFCGARYADASSAVGTSSTPLRETHSGPEGAAARTLINAARTGQPLATLVAVLKDGSDGNRFPIVQDQTDIGRREGDVVLPDDPYLSPRHARILRRGDTFVVRDLDSVNGVFCRIREPVDLKPTDAFLIGQQVIRFETLDEAELPLGPASVQGVLVFGTPEVPRLARLVQYTTEGVGRDVHYLYRDETVLGRETGDIVFTDDPFLSRRHAAITIDRAARRFVLRDLGSSNGTSLALRGERALRPGDQFRVGRHLFRFDPPGRST